MVWELRQEDWVHPLVAYEDLAAQVDQASNASGHLKATVKTDNVEQAEAAATPGTREDQDLLKSWSRTRATVASA